MVGKIYFEAYENEVYILLDVIWILSNIEFYYFQEKRETINFLNENCFKNFICLKVVSLKQNVDFTFLRK